VPESGIVHPYGGQRLNYNDFLLDDLRARKFREDKDKTYVYVHHCRLLFVGALQKFRAIMTLFIYLFIYFFGGGGGGRGIVLVFFFFMSFSSNPLPLAYPIPQLFVRVFILHFCRG
jgi:hypothetical protein